MVAIKVVEHTSKDANDASAEREALLATSLSHPNIVSTYKICVAHSSTGQAAGSSSSPSGSASGSASGPNPPPGALQSSRGSASRIGRTASGGRPPLHPGGSGSRPTSPHASRGQGRAGAGGRLPAGSGVPGRKGTFEDSAETNAGHSGRDGAAGALAGAAGGALPAPAPDPPRQPSAETRSDEEQAEAKERDRDARLVETWMLMEYCERGSLADALRSGRLRRPDTSGTPDMLAIIACLLDIASGMEYLHSAGVLHGDLKPGVPPARARRRRSEACVLSARAACAKGACARRAAPRGLRRCGGA